MYGPIIPGYNQSSPWPAPLTVPHSHWEQLAASRQLLHPFPPAPVLLSPLHLFFIATEEIKASQYGRTSPRDAFHWRGLAGANCLTIGQHFLRHLHCLSRMVVVAAAHSRHCRLHLSGWIAMEIANDVSPFSHALKVWREPY